MPIVATRVAGVADASTVAGLVHPLLDELRDGKEPNLDAMVHTAAAVLAYADD